MSKVEYNNVPSHKLKGNLQVKSMKGFRTVSDIGKYYEKKDTLSKGAFGKVFTAIHK